MIVKRMAWLAGVLLLFAAALWSTHWFRGVEPVPAPASPVEPIEGGAPDAQLMAALDRVAREGQRRAASQVVRPEASARHSAVTRPKDALSDEVVLGFYSQSDLDAFLAAARARGVDVLDVLRTLRAVRIRVKDEAQLESLLEVAPEPVDRAYNVAVRLPPVPDTARKAAESGYVGFGSQALAWLGAQANEAWGAGKTIAVLDSGVAADLLSGNGVAQIDLVGEDAEDDAAGHGTAVASLILGDSSGSVQGMAPGVELMSLKVVSEDGQGNAFTLARGIIDAVDGGADVVNVSLGTYGDSFVLEQAVTYAQEHDVLVVAAVGNDAVEGVMYPARYESVVAVAASDATGRHLYFSNRGDEVDLAAPGLMVNAAGEGGAVAFSGTSAAAPFVSGALAALLSNEPNLSASEALAAVLSTCSDAGAPGEDDELGNGVLDVQRLETRDEEGRYDAAVSAPYSSTGADGSLDLTFCAQNRGTATIETMTLQVRLGSREYDFSFGNVEVGETVSRQFSVTPEDIRAAGGLSVAASVSMDGIEDVVPGNNTVITTLGISEAP